MIIKNLKEAMDNGLEIFVQMNYCCGAKHVGRVLDLDEKYFTLLTFKQDYRTQFVFKIEDIVYVCLYKDNIINFGIKDEVYSQAKKILEQEGEL